MYRTFFVVSSLRILYAGNQSSIRDMNYQRKVFSRTWENHSFGLDKCGDYFLRFWRITFRRHFEQWQRYYISTGSIIIGTLVNGITTPTLKIYNFLSGQCISLLSSWAIKIDEISSQPVWRYTFPLDLAHLDLYLFTNIKKCLSRNSNNDVLAKWLPNLRSWGNPIIQMASANWSSIVSNSCIPKWQIKLVDLGKYCKFPFKHEFAY